MPERMWITMITRKAFDNMLLQKYGHNYNNYGLVSRQVLGLGAEGTPKEVELVYHERFEFRWD